jgi:hypothetical protein
MSQGTRMETIHRNLEELGELRQHMEADAERIRQQMQTRKSQFSVNLYTVYLEEQIKQIQNIRKYETQLLNEKKTLEAKSD